MGTSRTTARRKTSSKPEKKLIEFKWEGQNYVLDVKCDRVYRNWMAVETNRGFTILGAYRNSQPVPA